MPDGEANSEAHLEALLRAKAKAGECNYISLIARWSKDQTVLYGAYVKGDAGNQYFGESADPVEALCFALKRKPRRNKEPETSKKES